MVFFHEAVTSNRTNWTKDFSVKVLGKYTAQLFKKYILYLHIVSISIDSGRHTRKPSSQILAHTKDGYQSSRWLSTKLTMGRKAVEKNNFEGFLEHKMSWRQV